MVKHGRRTMVHMLASLLVAVCAVLAVSQPANSTGDNYPAVWRNQPLGATYDTWGMATRYCTSWVAWALHDRNGFEIPFHANAVDWSTRAATYGYVTNATPSMGSVAWWNGQPWNGGFGHVAYVDSISADGNTVTISEYNGPSGPGDYGTRSINKSAVSGYIHFQDVPSYPDAADGRSDLIVGRSPGGFAMAFGTANGMLAEGPVSLANWTVPSWAGIGDFNGDGRLDVLDAQSGGGFSVAIGQTNGTFTEGGVTLTGWGTGTWAGTGNFYGDNKGDLVVARASGGFAVAYGTASGLLAEGPVSLTNWTVPTWAGAGDLNGDSYTDILVKQSAGGFAIALGHANGIFTEGGVTLPGWGLGVGWAGLGRFNNDNRTDLVVARTGGGFAVAYAAANGTLTEGPVSLTNWTVPSWAGTGDFNGDSYTDILVAQTGGGFALALGHANGIFTEGGVVLPGWGVGPGWAGNGMFIGTKGYGYKKP